MHPHSPSALQNVIEANTYVCDLKSSKLKEPLLSSEFLSSKIDPISSLNFSALFFKKKLRTLFYNYFILYPFQNMATAFLRHAVCFL